MYSDENMLSLYQRLATEEHFVVLPGTLWWHFALRRLPDHAAADCEARRRFRWSAVVAEEPGKVPAEGDFMGKPC